ncbi:MAG: amidohydrolase/deacetylase family metallohydrolase [Anaerolineae bacterium]|nr:amidohydrolase/deacetylase family metallohydrolase [Anaerolineae bacterium]
MHFDLLIQNGTVIDVEGQHVGRYDVAITRNRVAAVEPSIPAESARQVFDASGQIVTPGMVDLHTHFYHSVTFWGIRPEPVAARSGVTTWLDVGSSGAYNFIGLREFIMRPSDLRLYALLNISGIGLTAPSWELRNPNYLDVDLCCKLVDLHRDLVLGIKARVDVGTTEGDIEGLRRAREAADRCELPLMVHIADGPPGLEAILGLMQPGDILTHCCTGRNNRLVTDSRKVREVARRAREAGVILDVGHGAGSFSFDSAEQMLADGFRPDVISTDIHQLAILGPCFDMPTTLSKFLALGMSLEDAVARATSAPARVLKLEHEIGTLRPGALADVAVFQLLDGDFTFYDVAMESRRGQQLLVNTLTVLNGRPMRRTEDDPPMPWIDLSDGQQQLRERGHTPWAMAEQTLG